MQSPGKRRPKGVTWFPPGYESEARRVQSSWVFVFTAKWFKLKHKYKDGDRDYGMTYILGFKKITSLHSILPSSSLISSQFSRNRSGIGGGLLSRVTCPFGLSLQGPCRVRGDPGILRRSWSRGVQRIGQVQSEEHQWWAWQYPGPSWWLSYCVLFAACITSSPGRQSHLDSHAGEGR